MKTCAREEKKLMKLELSLRKEIVLEDSSPSLDLKHAIQCAEILKKVMATSVSPVSREI
jgi:hypothetical protein